MEKIMQIPKQTKSMNVPMCVGGVRGDGGGCQLGNVNILWTLLNC